MNAIISKVRALLTHTHTHTLVSRGNFRQHTHDTSTRTTLRSTYLRTPTITFTNTNTHIHTHTPDVLLLECVVDLIEGLVARLELLVPLLKLQPPLLHLYTNESVVVSTEFLAGLTWRRAVGFSPSSKMGLGNCAKSLVRCTWGEARCLSANDKVVSSSTALMTCNSKRANPNICGR